MAPNPFTAFVSGLQAPKYTGLNLTPAAPVGTKSYASPAQLASFKAPTASPAATSSQIPTTPKKTTTLSTPAAQSYITSQLPAQSPVPAVSQTQPYSEPEQQTYSQGSDGTITPDTKAKKTKPADAAYRAALDSYISSLDASSAINNRAAKTELTGRREADSIIDSPGALLGGAQQMASLSRRHTASELADLGVAQQGANSAQTTALARLNYEKGLLPSTEGFNLSPGQSRYQYNPETGQTELVASGGADTPNTPASIQEYNFAKEQGYAGSFDDFKNGGGANNQNAILSPAEAQSLGVPYGTTRQAAFGQTPTKPLTESQAKDLTYGQRGQQASTIIDQLASNIVGFNPVAYAGYGALEPNAVGNALVPDNVRQYKQAERNFLTAILRRESGASISPSEFSVAEKQYFPRPGDDAQTLTQKKQLRDTAINSFLQNAGQSGVQGGNSNDPFSAANFFGS